MAPPLRLYEAPPKTVAYPKQAGVTKLSQFHFQTVNGHQVYRTDKVRSPIFHVFRGSLEGEKNKKNNNYTPSTGTRCTAPTR
jgi:hypothetical protein